MSKYITREIEEVCLERIKSGLITAIIGARQVGKTTLLMRIRDVISKSNVISEKRIFYFSLDDPIIRSELNKNFNYIEKEIDKLLGEPLSRVKEPVLLIIDEVQKSPVIFDWLKIVYDQYPKVIKIVVSGSSSLEIKKKSSESLGGRLTFLRLYPFTLREIIIEETGVTLPNPLWNNFSQSKFIDFLLERQSLIYKYKSMLETLFERILIEGCLPAVYTSKTLDEKRLKLSSMVTTYLERDIRALNEVGSIDDFSNLLKTVSFEVGSIFISSELGIAYNTLKKYLSILKETFILNPLSPLFYKIRKQVVKSSKMYFFDVGVANFLSKRTEMEHIRNIGGFLFENILIKSFESENNNQIVPKNIYFWRDYEGHEIDLIYEISEGRYIPIEMGLSRNLAKDKIINYKAFFNKFEDSPFGLFLYQGEVKEEKIFGKSVYLVPWWLWW
jgi:predicted AAA+ superfamily ATPase